MLGMLLHILNIQLIKSSTQSTNDWAPSMFQFLWQDLGMDIAVNKAGEKVLVSWRHLQNLKKICPIVKCPVCNTGQPLLCTKHEFGTLVDEVGVKVMSHSPQLQES